MQVLLCTRKFFRNFIFRVFSGSCNFGNARFPAELAKHEQTKNIRFTPRLAELIEGKADLHDVLEQNIEKLREDQQNIESAIEMCSELEADADDWDSIDPPKYLKNIYEGEQNGAHFAKAGEISFRQLNLAITLIGFLAAVPTPQNKLYSERSNDPIPDDIRGNKKDGDEYDTIGNVIEKGGKRKIALIAAVVIFVLFAAWNAYNWWGGLAIVNKYIVDYNRAGITVAEPESDELAKLIGIDPLVSDAAETHTLFKFHAQGGIQLTLRHSEDGEWSDLSNHEIDADEGYIWFTGDPSSVIEIHVIADGKSETFDIETRDSSYTSEDTELLVNDGQMPLADEPEIIIFIRNDKLLSEVYGGDKSDMYNDIADNTPQDGCYEIIARKL